MRARSLIRDHGLLHPPAGSTIDTLLSTGKCDEIRSVTCSATTWH